MITDPAESLSWLLDHTTSTQVLAGREHLEAVLDEHRHFAALIEQLREHECPGAGRPRIRPRDLPALIKAERRRRGLSLRVAAKEAGVSFSTLARFEQGRLPYLDCYFTIAAWLGVSPDSLADAPAEGIAS